MPMGTNICVGVELAEAPLNSPLTLVSSEVDPGSRARLVSLGLRVGSQFSLISRTTGGGRVAVVAGTRIALGSKLLKKMRAEVSN